MRAIVLTLLALAAAAAGCAGSPEESRSETNYGDQCVEDASAYYEGAEGGAATTDPPPQPVPAEDRMGGPYCPEETGNAEGGALDTSTKETAEDS